jgi:hypothetical protein
MPTPDQLIARIAERQHGVFTFDQALSCCFSPRMVQQRVETRRWIRVHKGVYRLAGSVRTFEQLTMARVLACGRGAVAFRRNAAALFKVEGLEDGIVEVAVAGDRKPRLAVRRVTLVRSDIALINVIPVTKPERMMMDLAGVLDPDPLEDALDDTIRRRLVLPRRLEERLERTSRRGQKGLGILLEMVRTRTTSNAAGSGRENTVRRALKRAGLPEPVRQFSVFDADGTFVARPDLSYPERRVYIEYDGGHHGSPRRQQADIDRQNRLSALGWLPIALTKVTMQGPMSVMVDLVRRTWEGTQH